VYAAFVPVGVCVCVHAGLSVWTWEEGYSG